MVTPHARNRAVLPLADGTIPVVSLQCAPMKWIVVVVLVVIAILAAVVAVEYFTVAIHALPSWLPGHKATIAGHKHPPRGHYRKRGAVAAVIAFILLVIAGFLTYRNLQSGRTSTPTPTATA